MPQQRNKTIITKLGNHIGDLKYTAATAIELVLTLHSSNTRGNTNRVHTYWVEVMAPLA